MKQSSGFTLTELLVTIAIIGILSGIVISNSLNTYRDSQVTSLAVQLAGWLEEISQSPEATGQSCTVTFNGAITSGISISNGSQLASVSPAGCAPDASFTASVPFLNTQIAVGASSSSIVFTPRNSITSTNDIQIRFAHSNQPPTRCIRISSVLGLIRLGRNDASSSVTASCPASSFDSI